MEWIWNAWTSDTTGLLILAYITVVQSIAIVGLARSRHKLLRETRLQTDRHS